MKEALAYFIGRQKLVAQAMTEMGLDLDEVAKYGSLAWASNLPPDETGKVVKSVEDFEKHAESENAEAQKFFQIAQRVSERNLSQDGIWRDSEQNEWRYFLHGGGCRLTNIKTREPIDWDCPDVNSYDRWKFMFHLQWQLLSQERAGKLVSANLWVRHSLEPLMEEIINESSNH